MPHTDNTPEVIRTIVSRGYDAVTDRIWFRCGDRQIRTIDATDRGPASNYHEMPDAKWVYEHGTVV